MVSVPIGLDTLVVIDPLVIFFFPLCLKFGPANACLQTQH